MNITRGVIAKAQKVILYGPEGIGKSSFASQFPDPLFIDTEGSTSNMNVARLDKPTSWTMLMQQINFVKQTNPCKTLVIDTIDWAERIAIEYLCSVNQKKSIEDFGYGAGYIKLEEEIGRLLNLLSDVVDMGINVVLTAHAQIRKFEQPDEMGAYDRYELKLGKKTSSRTSSLVKEWADMVLFCNYKTLSVATDDKGKKFKAQGGKRVIYTSHHPAWDAKNRFGLPEELELDFSRIAHIFNPKPQQAQQLEEPAEKPMPDETQTSESSQQLSQQQSPQQSIEKEEKESQPDFSRSEADPSGLPKALQDLMNQNNVLPIEIQQAVAQRGYYTADTPMENYDASFVNGVLIGAWEQVFGMIQEARKKQEF